MKIHIQKAVDECIEVMGDEFFVADDIEKAYQMIAHEEKMAQKVVDAQIDQAWTEQEELKASQEVVCNPVQESVPVTVSVAPKVEKVKSVVVRNRAYKRKKEARAKHKMRATALIIQNAYRARDREAMNNVTFEKHKFGVRKWPKDKTVLAQDFWARARKLKLVTGEIC